MSTPKAKPARAVRLKKAKVTTPEARELHAALEDVVDQLNAHPAIATAPGSAEAWASSLPIGVPIPLPMHLYPSNFTLPANVVECDGRTINESRSILNGKTLDDLNGGGYFLRAGDVAGVVQADQVKDHVHTMNHAHDVTVYNDVGGGTVAAKGAGVIPLHSPNAAETFNGNTGNPTAGGGTETRPKNVSHVYVIRLF